MAGFGGNGGGGDDDEEYRSFTQLAAREASQSGEKRKKGGYLGGRLKRFPGRRRRRRLRSLHLTYHHASRHSYASSTVRVGHNITIADAEKRYGYQPHRVEQVGVLLVVISA